MRLKTKNKGFTLIELLVVVAIIGLLSTMAVVALNGARRKSRDAIRVNDIKQIQTALEMYQMDQGHYPIETTAIELGDDDGTYSTLSSTNGFSSTAAGTTFMGQVPGDPGGGGTEGTFQYSYITDANGYTYTIDFGITGKVGGELECDTVAQGCCEATQDGLTCGTAD